MARGARGMQGGSSQAFIMSELVRSCLATVIVQRSGGAGQREGAPPLKKVSTMVTVVSH